MNLNRTILDLYTRRDKNQLSRLKDTLEASQKDYGIFFDEFLEMFSDKMDENDKSSPIWKAYKKRYDEFQDLSSNLKRIDYYMGML